MTTASTIGCAAETPGTPRTSSTMSSGTPASPEATSSCAFPAILSTVRRSDVRNDADDSSMAMYTPTPRETPARVSSVMTQCFLK